MFTFLLIVHALIAASLVTVILMQRSEGGGLGTGGGPAGLMTARGAADFLTRATTVLGTLFIVMSIALAAFATVARAPSKIDTSLARQQAVPLAGDQPAPTDPLAAAAASGAAANVAAPAAAQPAAPLVGAATATKPAPRATARPSIDTKPQPSLDKVPLREVPTAAAPNPTTTTPDKAPVPPAAGNSAAPPQP